MNSTESLARRAIRLSALMALGVLVSVVVRAQVIQVFIIESSSMEPALSAGDRVVVEKVTSRLDPIRHGDIVVVSPGGDAPGWIDRLAGRGREVPLIKRVAGLAGDRIAVVDGALVRNGVQVFEPWALLAPDDTFSTLTVPDGAVFLLGDNRAFSADSRGELGPVDRGQLIGRARWRLHPRAGRL